jgi:hypothetical protein
MFLGMLGVEVWRSVRFAHMVHLANKAGSGSGSGSGSNCSRSRATRASKMLTTAGAGAGDSPSGGSGASLWVQNPMKGAVGGATGNTVVGQVGANALMCLCVCVCVWRISASLGVYVWGLCRPGVVLSRRKAGLGLVHRLSSCAGRGCRCGPQSPRRAWRR